MFQVFRVFQVFQVFRVFQVFQVFQVFHVFHPKEKVLTKRASVRLSLRIRPHSFPTEQHLTKKRYERLIFPDVWWLFRM